LFSQLQGWVIRLYDTFCFAGVTNYICLRAVGGLGASSAASNVDTSDGGGGGCFIDIITSQ